MFGRLPVDRCPALSRSEDLIGSSISAACRSFPVISSFVSLDSSGTEVRWPLRWVGDFPSRIVRQNDPFLLEDVPDVVVLVIAGSRPI